MRPGSTRQSSPSGTARLTRWNGNGTARWMTVPETVKSDIQAAGEQNRDAQRPAPRLRRCRAAALLSWYFGLQIDRLRRPKILFSGRRGATSPGGGGVEERRAAG